MTESLRWCRIERMSVLKAFAKICDAANIAENRKNFVCNTIVSRGDYGNTKMLRSKNSKYRTDLHLVSKKCQLEILKQFDKHGENR